MKVLNLDKIGKKEQRTLNIGGTAYLVNEMTVANFIETTRAAEKITVETSLAEQIEATIAMILRSVPTISQEVLNVLTLEQLQTIVAFVRGDEVEGAESDAPQEGTPAGN